MVRPELRAQALKASTTEGRAREWIEKISKVPGELPAFNLYCGVYWAGVANLWRKAVSRQAEAPLWVLSAGYGLIPYDAVIAPYAATLRPNDPDSVVTGAGAAEVKHWWGTLREWVGPKAGAPRDLLALAKAHSRTLWIVVGGTHYVGALAEQLEAVHQRDGNSGRFVLVSPGVSSRSAPPAIKAALLRADARWESRLGRGKVSIGVKIATHLFDRADGDPEAIPGARRWMQRETELLEGLEVPRRTPQSDDDVSRYVRKVLKKQRDLSFSRTLRAFRDSGLACEYRRFRGLYEAVKESMHAKA
jgi:hypothetical protein